MGQSIAGIKGCIALKNKEEDRRADLNAHPSKSCGVGATRTGRTSDPVGGRRGPRRGGGEAGRRGGADFDASRKREARVHARASANPDHAEPPVTPRRAALVKNPPAPAAAALRPRRPPIAPPARRIRQRRIRHPGVPGPQRIRVQGPGQRHPRGGGSALIGHRDRPDLCRQTGRAPAHGRPRHGSRARRSRGGRSGPGRTQARAERMDAGSAAPWQSP
jgi:hypothetical protein